MLSGLVILSQLLVHLSCFYLFIALLGTRVFIIDSEPAYQCRNVTKKGKTPLEYCCVYSSVVFEWFVAQEEKASMIYSGQCSVMLTLHSSTF